MKQQFCGDIGRFYEGLAVVERNGEWFHIKEGGEPAYLERYKMVEYFQNGFAWVQKKDDTWVKINKQGQEAKMESANAPL